ncbi:hypothetical protein D9M68_999610 [compost metagenome]
MEVADRIRIKDVVVLNNLGQEVYRTAYNNTSGSKYQLNLPAHLSAGMYQLHISTGEGTTVRKIELLK